MEVNNLTFFIFHRFIGHYIYSISGSDDLKFLSIFLGFLLTLLILLSVLALSYFYCFFAH